MTYDPAAARLDGFRPLLSGIAEGAARREAERIQPYKQVGLLRDAGFTALTVPVEHGGAGVSVTELFALLIALAEADSNLPQLLRAHFAFVEGLLLEPRRPDREKWFVRVADGAIVGNASHERGPATVGSLATKLTPAAQGWLLNGEKYYSTGSLFADWITTTAEDPAGETVSVSVPAEAEGVERRDDWLGFGQRLTGSGTTTFTDVAITPDLLHRYQPNRTRTLLPAFLQTVLLASLAGVGRAATRDAARFVRERTRVYEHGAGTTAATDPLVQSVVGRLAADAAAAETLTLDAARHIERAHEAIAAGEEADELIDAAELRTVQAQLTVVELVQRITTKLFDVGGASATSTQHGFDRHWRNARTLSSHNPAIYQERAIGDHVVNGTGLTYFWATGEASRSN
ncbi:acyl-CoA dehydrogenase family protein [Amycolatopsis ultiminotia]|uniref:Dibenzothiophene monooxygenase n=1 Tax=Amycolatopsis ultiminotia TaxID=543629 RepID=A0ABP6XBL8_9PSEU